MNFCYKIMNWYQKNSRNLPWRKTKNPYYILVSEFMLQQTRVKKVIKYYLNFIQKFPDIKSLSNAKEKDVLKIWEGLGYYSRAVNLHCFAKKIVKKNIRFPKKYKELIKYKGIGLYTAAAISSICFNEKIPAIDGNVGRVFTRYLGIDKNINLLKTKKELKKIILNIMETNSPGIFNQAIMDLGSLICTPIKYKCFICPVQDSCYSMKNNIVHKFPVKEKKNKIKKKNFFYYLFIRNDYGEIFFKKRSMNRIWGGLYEFPLIESKIKLNNSKLKYLIFKYFQEKTFFYFLHQEKIKLSNRLIYIQFLECKFDHFSLIKKKFFQKKIYLIPKKFINQYPFSKPILSFLRRIEII